MNSADDIFNSGCQAIVNPVNCLGVMGKGLALIFKNKYPENYHNYVKHCNSKSFVIGTCITFKENNQYIVNFPTKIDWRKPSSLSYIESGLIALTRHINHFKFKTIAIPALGCGEGTLNFDNVLVLINKYLGEFDINILVYPPR